MNQFGRIVMGYHGCPANRPNALEFVRGLIAGTRQVEDWRPSSNEHDWLGGGVYFWEYGPKRAKQWAGEDGEVIGALIQLGICFDLTDPGCETLLRATYESVASKYASESKSLPTNDFDGRDLNTDGRAMTNLDMQKMLHEAIIEFAAKPSDVAFLDMQRSGLIDAEGVPQEWDAFLAIVASNATDYRKATHFRCRKQTLGLPGRAAIDVSRDSMIAYLNEGKRIITAIVDEDSKAIRVGEQVHLTSHETIRTDRNDIAEDNLGSLPQMTTVHSSL